MYSLQLKLLEESVMKSLNDSGEYIRFESISIKKKRVADMSEGDCIYIGESMPKIFIQRDGELYAELFLYADDDFLKGSVSYLPEGYTEERDIKKGRVIIEPRLSPALFESYENIKLSVNSFESIYLFIDNNLFAKASLKRSENGYILKIEEMFDE